MDDDNPCQIFLEIKDGKLCLMVWNDSAEPQFIYFDPT